MRAIGGSGPLSQLIHVLSHAARIGSPVGSRCVFHELWHHFLIGAGLGSKEASQGRVESRVPAVLVDVNVSVEDLADLHPKIGIIFGQLSS